MAKHELRQRVQEQLGSIVDAVNAALLGTGLEQLRNDLERMGRGQRLPHWYEQLASDGSLPNLDGKTIGSVIEMLFVAVLETKVFTDGCTPPLRINPASGVDLPELDLGVKSPSKNFCTSEPFFSAYERLHGSEFDIVVLLTDYQAAKKSPPLRLQILDGQYLGNTEVADRGLCQIARAHREWLLADSEARAKKLFRFLAYVNQSDWRAKYLLKLISVLDSPAGIKALIEDAPQHLARTNAQRLRRNAEVLPDELLSTIQGISRVEPLYLGTLEAADNWVVDTQKDFGRFPNDNEWQRLRSGPMNGKIGMSYALQWRYNFGPLFR